MYNPQHQPEYKFNEELVLKQLQQYIDNTYNQHYSMNKIQSTEFIFDAGHGEGFCLGNMIKYTQRFGKKGGKDMKDLFKVIHYTVILLGEMQKQNKEA